MTSETVPRDTPVDQDPGPPDELRRYVARHPEWPDKLILMARELDGHTLTIWTAGDVRSVEESG
jgi:hypothetical protein